jgi:RNA polymerase sigma factor (sigma-70 family)
MSRSPALGSLVRAAAAGDERAWDSLVARYAPLVRSIARRHRLSPADQDDVLQRTWLALFRSIGRLKTPEALGGWLSTTAANESRQLLRASGRELAVGELPESDLREAQEPVALEDHLMGADRRKALRSAVLRLDGRQKAMLEMLMAPSTPSYAEISASLGVPIGSIGPTRARSLARLRRQPQIAQLFDDPPRAARPTRPPRAEQQNLL